MITWKPTIDGNDILIGSFAEPVTASWFGGPADALDSGQTASGIDNTHLGVMGCSLPMYRTASGVDVPSCADSPLGPIPWRSIIIVNALIRGPQGVPIVGSQAKPELIDVGPATGLVNGVYLNRPIDLCPSVFLALGGNLSIGLLHVFLRVVGGAKYLRG